MIGTRALFSSSAPHTALAFAAAATLLLFTAGCATPTRRGAPPNAASVGFGRAALGPGLGTLSSTQRATATAQVMATDRAFARTMADRDFSAFMSFVSPEAVFFSGRTVQRGAAAIATEWQPYFRPGPAPFSWTPDQVEVLGSGTLALSTGTISQLGHVVSRYNAVWQRVAPNTWRIVFDKGEALCSAPN